MNYNEFKEEVRNTFADYLPEGYKDMDVLIAPVRKVNRTLDGLTLVSRERTNAPVLYVNDMYQTYLETGDLQGTISSAANNLLDNMCRTPNSFNLKQLVPEKVKENIVFRLINTEKNRELLKDMPHREIMDLSVVYCYLMDDLEDVLGTIWIRNTFADYLGLDEQVLYEAAVENTREILPPQLITVTKLCKEESDCPDENDGAVDAVTEGAEVMYLVSNDRLSYGAVNMMYTDILDDIRQGCGKNLYIFPSSLHEIIVMPEHGNDNVHFLKAIVKEANRNDVRPEDILSDNVYFYDGKCLRMAETVEKGLS